MFFLVLALHISGLIVGSVLAWRHRDTYWGPMALLVTALVVPAASFGLVFLITR